MRTGKKCGWIVAAVSGMFALGAMADDVLVGFDKGALTGSYSNKNANVEAAGFEGNQVWSDNGTLGDDWRITGESWGSKDGTFGSLGTGATTNSAGDDGGFWTDNANNTSYMDITIQNTGAGTYKLTSFCFDAWRQWAKGAEGYSVSIVAGDLELVDDFATGTFTQNSSIGGYFDYDVSLTNLSDTVLASGEEAVFRLQMVDSAPAENGQLFIDNIAVLGVEYVPEAGDVLVGFDKGAVTTSYSNKNANVEAAGFEGNQVWSDTGTLGDEWNITGESYGSKDGTFGSLGSGATTGTAGDDGGFWTDNEYNTSYMDITIQNNTVTNYELTSFCFDAWRQWPAGCEGYSVSVVAGDLALVDDFATGSFAQNSSIGGYYDYDVSLTDLADNILTPGEEAVFRLKMVDSAPSSSGQLFIDNIAVLGMVTDQTAPPEPDPEAAFVSLEPVLGNQIKLTIDVVGSLTNFTLLSKTSLDESAWSAVAHSDDGVNAFLTTNLNYSSSDGTNVIIYVEAGDTQKFYGLQY